MRLRQLGDPVLRKRANPIEVFDGALQQLTLELIEGMNRWLGCGLAAPQIGVLSRVFVIRAPSDETLPEEEWKKLPTRIFINPQLSEPSSEMTQVSEGCLSIPGVRAPVIRPFAITVEFSDLQGQMHKERFEGFIARVIMHENDHLNGRLFVDRIKGAQKRKIERELQILERKNGR